MSKSRPVAKLAQPRALAAFKTHAVEWRRQSLTVGCAATVCFIVGSFSKRQVAADKTAERLRAVVAQTGIKDSQVAKYIGLARSLANHMAVSADRPLAAVLKTTSPSRATNIVASFLTKNKVTTLEGMTVLLGKYRRSKAKKTPPAAKPSPKESSGRPVRIGRKGAAHATSGQSAQVVPLSAPTLRKLTAEQIVLAAEQSGHSPMSIAAAAVTTMTTTKDLLKLEGLISSRMNELSPKSRTVTPLRRAS
jgi:hypothetical protein